ncbi:hypothetical protein SFR_3862 [Streptomyces sp. FR-008]|nr:hypothetical protein SFR_3862 [Streptomyces sp. FR-008]
MAQVLLQELEGEGLEALGAGGDLREYVDAVDVLLHQALEAADLPLDAAQAFEVLGLVVVVAVDAPVVVGDDLVPCRLGRLARLCCLVRHVRPLVCLRVRGVARCGSPLVGGGCGGVRGSGLGGRHRVLLEGVSGVGAGYSSEKSYRRLGVGRCPVPAKTSQYHPPRIPLVGIWYRTSPY